MPKTGSAVICVHERRAVGRMGCWVAAVVAATGLVLPAVQAQQTPVPQFRAGVDLVPVDVTVLDKDRKPVRGLTAADFSVFEDGKPRPVVVFTPIELPVPAALAPTAAAWTRDVPRDLATNDVAREGRLVIIVMDRTIRFDDQVTARRIALRTVDELAPTDLAALVFTSQFAGRGKSVDFTADRALLRAAIQAPFATAGVTGISQRLDDPDNLMSGDCHCGVCVLDALTRIADSVRDVVGRRKVLFFVGTYARVEEAMSVRGGNQAVVCTTALSHARERMIRATQLANLAVYSFDAVGLETCGNSPMPGADVVLTCSRAIQQRQANFRSLADTVRGRNIMNTNTPEMQVASVLAESSAYYLLAFERASAEPDGRDHKIEVRTRKSGVTIYSRKGYVAPRPEPAAPARPVETASIASAPTLSAITGVLPKTALALGVSIASFAATKDLSLTTLAIHVQRPATAADTTAAPGTRNTEIVVAAFDRLGQSVAVARQMAQLSGPVSGAAMLRYEVLSHLRLKPGRYDIRVAATDATTGDTGSVQTTIDVPDFDGERLALSELLLTLPSVGGAVPDELAPILPVMPTPKRTFAVADRPTVFVRVYQGGKDALTDVPVTVRIVDTQGKTALETTTALAALRFAANRSADHRLELPLASLAPGEYLLTISATIVNDKKTARRDVRFSVR